jgi:hypothetical protein
MAAAPRKVFQTGIPGFDTVLGGGIPPRQTLIVTGNPGSGKTVLCNQIAFLVAARGLPVVLATVTSEPHDKLIEELSGFTFFRRAIPDRTVRATGSPGAPVRCTRPRRCRCTPRARPMPHREKLDEKRAQ